MFGLMISMNVLGQGNNSISGIVIDGNTREVLPGAAIQVENTAFGTATAADGHFKLAGIQTSSAALLVSYLGYEKQRIEVDFSKESSIFLEITLQADATMLDQVQITDEAEGQVKAMIEQKTASNIKNIVSSEQLEEFPDMTAAQAMQRIPGITLQRDQGEGRFIQLRGTPPELTNFNINGEQIPSPEGGVRYVGMDVISADQIDQIEITKVLTPDMDADGIGGTVNIKTKQAMSRKPEINGTLAGGYNHLRQTPNFQAQLAFGRRYGKKEEFGIYLNGSYFVNSYGSDNMEFKYVKGPFFGGNPDTTEANYQVQYTEFQLRHYNIVRSRTGFSGTLDYRFNDHSKIYVRGIYNRFTDDETRRRKIYTLDDAVTENLYLYGGLEHDIKDRLKIQSLTSINLGGEHRLNASGFSIDYEFAYSFAKEEEPNRLETTFENFGQAITMKIDKSDPEWPRITYPNPGNAIYADDYARYDLDEHLMSTTDIKDENVAGKLNFTLPYGKNPENSGFVKFGGKVRIKKKISDVEVKNYAAYKLNQYYPDYGDTLSLVNVEDGFRTDDLFGEGYVLEYIPGADNMREFYDFNAAHFVYGSKGYTESRIKSNDEDYTAHEHIYAAFAMVQHDFRKLMLLGGLRYERTYVDYRANRITTTRTGYYDTMNVLTDTRNLDFLLPQVQVKYSFTDDLNLRGALTYTYSRPNFDDVIPYRHEERDDITYGNPDLDYPTSLNVDLLVEKYLLDGGIISGGLFYKEIDNFIFNYTRYAHEGDPENWSLKKITTPLNGIESFVYGLEAQTQFKMFFLPGIGQYFGLFLNYTYTYSEAFIYKRYPANFSTDIIEPGQDPEDVFYNTDEREQITLPGQAMHTANAALFFESTKVYAKISANYHDTFLYSLGGDSDLDEYYGEALHLDFNAFYRINTHFTIFTDVVNLTNAPLRFYLGKPDQERVQKKEYYSWTARIGIRLSF